LSSNFQYFREFDQYIAIILINILVNISAILENIDNIEYIDQYFPILLENIDTGYNRL